MRIFKRGFCAVISNIGNSALVFSVYLIISVIILAGFAIENSVTETVEKIRKQIGADITYSNTDGVRSMEAWGRNTLNHEIASELEMAEFTEKADYYVVSQGKPLDFVAIDEEDLLVHGVTTSTFDDSFVSGEISMSSGKHITSSDKDSCLVSNDIMRLNKLNIGDRISIVSVRGDYRCELTILGSFSCNVEWVKDEYLPENTSNIVIVPYEVAFDLNDEKYINKARFHINDPFMSSTFLSLASNNAPGIEEHFIVDDIKYRGVASAVRNTEQIARFIVIIAVVLGVGVLLALSLHTLMKREYEIGLLMSMGENALAIFLQFLFEMLTLIFLAILGAYITISVSRSYLFDLFKLEAQLVVDFASVIKLMMYSLGILSAVSTVSAYRILTCNPQKILKAM